MILFAGIPSEPPLAMAIAAAEERGVDFRIFNPRRAAGCDMRLVAQGEAISPTLWIGGEEVDLNDCGGIYARSVDPATLPESRAARARGDAGLAEHISTVCLMFDQALDCAVSLVVNRPSAMTSNFSKPAQLQAIANTGLEVPPTLVTNDPDAVREFKIRHGRIIYKSTSAVRSIVREWNEDEGPPLEKVRGLPVQFQRLIEGEDIRVHVVGDRFFAAAVRSGATDYRYDGDTQMEALSLPVAVIDACVSLAKTLCLPFAGIDLRRTRDGSFLCFEVNPSPAYSYFEELSGQPISAALVDLLERGV
jgi:glutathione synthase/RimK-type ligase-like ATP-grasp enzyme